MRNPRLRPVCKLSPAEDLFESRRGTSSWITHAPAWLEGQTLGRAGLEGRNLLQPFMESCSEVGDAPVTDRVARRMHCALHKVENISQLGKGSVCPMHLCPCFRDVQYLSFFSLPSPMHKTHSEHKRAFFQLGLTHAHRRMMGTTFRTFTFY